MSLLLRSGQRSGQRLMVSWYALNVEDYATLRRCCWQRARLQIL